MKDITFKNFDGYKYIDGGVCAAQGFRASGVYAGIKNNPVCLHTGLFFRI